MKQLTAYRCEFCGKIYFNQYDCEECEAAHFGLTRRTYLDWRMLNKDAAQAGKMLGVCSDERNRKAFDETVERLVKFETYYGIENRKKPTDFYY